MKKLFSVILYILLHLNLNSQSWHSKIEPSLWESASDQSPVEFLIILSAQADLSAAAFLPQKEDKGTYVYHQLKTTAEQTQGVVLATLESYDAPAQSFFLINAIWSKGNQGLLEAIARLSSVKAIHSNPKIRMQEPVEASISGPRTLEWGLSNINADDVWAMGFKGNNIIVAGQDTGYDWDVPAIKEKYRGWDVNSQSADHNYNWHDAIHSNAGSNICGTNSPEPCDDNNHGTHTMGTMVGLEGANEIGVAPEAQWIGCRNMDNGVGTPTTYIECFEWFLAPTDLNDANPDPSKAPHVINNSWACPPSEGCNTGNFADMEAAVNNLLAAGVVVVASAGNSGSNCSTIDWPPAIFEGSFTVGASDAGNAIASFSSRGPVIVDGSNRKKPNVTAPGVGVRSCIRNGAYASWNGTSMSGPHVAGAIALLLSADPSFAGQINQIENLFESTSGGQLTTEGCGGDTPTTLPNNTYGHGIIDVEEAVNSALNLLPVELISFRGQLHHKTVNLNWEIALPGTLNHFELEHSTSYTQWDILNKNVFYPNQSHYQYMHRPALTGTHYYRLRMVDMDGSFEYSPVVTIQINDSDTPGLFPNPATDQLHLDFQSPTQLRLIQIFDIHGRLIHQPKFQLDELSSRFTIDLTNIAGGIYYLRLITLDSPEMVFHQSFLIE